MTNPMRWFVTEVNCFDILEILYTFGFQVRKLRIKHNLSQLELSKRADVALDQVKKIESGRTARFTSVVKVLSCLGKSPWFNTLAPVISISPMDILKNGTERTRVRRSRLNDLARVP